MNIDQNVQDNDSCLMKLYHVQVVFSKDTLDPGFVHPRFTLDTLLYDKTRQDLAKTIELIEKQCVYSDFLGIFTDFGILKGVKMG